MASIGGLSSSTSSLVSGGGGLHGYGGLASGLDRDTLIESMTYATRAKIAKQQQKKQTFQWKQDAYRSVTDKLVALSSKYMDYTNPSTNLSNSSLFAKTNIVANGKNSSKVSVSSNGTNAADSLTILGVKQLAQNASATSTGTVSDRTLTTGQVATDQMVSSFKNQTLDIKYGDKTYTVSFGNIDTGAGDTAIEKGLNDALKNVSVGGGKTLADVMKFSVSGGQATMTASGDDLYIAGGSKAIMKAMSLNSETIKENPVKINGSRTLGLKTGMTFEERIVGQSLTFNYNGKETTIHISQEALDEAKAELNKESAGSGNDARNAAAKVIKDGLDKAFGSGRINARFDTADNKFKFEATLPNGNPDNSSILTLSYGSAGMLGDDGAFNVRAGENNRLNMNVSLEYSGLSGIADLVKGRQPDQELDLTINGKKISGITRDSTLNDVMNAINKSDAGVQISYLQNSDKFTIASTVEGASGKIDIKGSAGGLASLLFGKTDIEKTGQDAIVTVQYAGSSEQVNLVRSSNTFTQDGLNITVKGKFGAYKGTADDPADDKIDIDANAGEEITFESKANVDSLLTTIKDMVAAYNEAVDLVNSLVSTKPDRDYAPLTDDQKEDMTDEQIEKWEKKAKEGILFGDDLLRNLSSDLRFVAGGSLMNQLAEIGITEVTGYSSNGKLSIDENKLKNALEADPEKVGKLFADPNNGLMTNMKKVTDSYAKTWGTKGSLIQRAGSESSAISLTDNELYKSMKDIDDIIKQLQERLKSEQDRYISQFTRLETVIAQMNSQSSCLSSMSGGY